MNTTKLVGGDVLKDEFFRKKLAFRDSEPTFAVKKSKIVSSSYRKRCNFAKGKTAGFFIIKYVLKTKTE